MAFLIILVYGHRLFAELFFFCTQKSIYYFHFKWVRHRLLCRLWLRLWIWLAVHTQSSVVSQFYLIVYTSLNRSSISTSFLILSFPYVSDWNNEPEHREHSEHCQHCECVLPLPHIFCCLLLLLVCFAFFILFSIFLFLFHSKLVMIVRLFISTFPYYCLLLYGKAYNIKIPINMM